MLTDKIFRMNTNCLYLFFIEKVAPKIKECMMKKGSLMIAYQPLKSKGLVNFFRLVTGNPAATRDDMEFVVDEIDRIGYQLDLL